MPIETTPEEEPVIQAREAADAGALSQRDRLTEMLAELEQNYGPMDPVHMEEARQAWPALENHVGKRLGS
jgi:predicted component of type VI protein secretion system